MSDALDRLSKLVSQADRAANDHEREAFMKAAEKMSAKIGVDLAVARAHTVNKEKREEPTEKTIKVNSFGARPIHRTAMMDLWLSIADAQGIQCTISRDNYYAFAYGFPSDIELAETLFGMASFQMVSEADAAVKRGDQKFVIDEVNRKIGLDGRIYRRNFYQGFTRKVSARLYEARQEAIREADAESGGGTELVLRDKAREVSDFYAEKTKHLSLRGTYKGLDNSDSLSRDAIRQGALAGSRANLGLSNKDVGGANRPELD